MGILLFTEELICFKVRWWHGSHSRVRSVLTLITPPRSWRSSGNGQVKAARVGWRMKRWRKKLPNAKQFPPLAPSSTPTSCSDKLEAASCQSWSLNQSRRAVLRSRPRAIYIGNTVHFVSGVICSSLLFLPSNHGYNTYLRSRENNNLFCLYLGNEEYLHSHIQTVGWSLNTLSGEDFAQSGGFVMCDGPVLLRAVLLLQVIRFVSHDQKASQW